jgi:hypothetical protein
VTGPCEHRNEISCSVGGEFLDWLSDCQLLKKVGWLVWEFSFQTFYVPECTIGHRIDCTYCKF